MSYNVQTDFTPVYELANSLKLFSDKKMIKSADLGPQWHKNVSIGLSTEFLADIEEFTRVDGCFHYLFLLIWRSPKKDSVEGFLGWLEKLSPGEIYEMLSPIVAGGLPNDLGNLRDLYVKLLSQWQQHYFSRVDPFVMEVMLKSANEVAAEKIADPIDFVERISGGIRIPYAEGLETIVLIPSYHQAPFITYHRHRTLFLVLYSVDLPSIEPFTPSSALLRLTKALSDENRLKLLKKLAQGPQNFTGLFSGLDVSKSTVHHHIMTLRVAGLISVLVSQEYGHDTYILRASGIDELSVHLKNYLSL
ncbi:MAG: winged helix-turn-helix domain-containing protein [Bacillota bacterium]|nr:winged helix-turn-helix domain-containing protein [Bacillota bacterium]